MTTTKTCRVCGEPFEANKPTTDICRACWYAEEMTDADKRFEPLRDALIAEHFVAGEVWQTGGMTMVYAVPLTEHPDWDFLTFGDDGDSVGLQRGEAMAAAGDYRYLVPRGDIDTDGVVDVALLAKVAADYLRDGTVPGDWGIFDE